MHMRMLKSLLGIVSAVFCINDATAQQQAMHDARTFDCGFIYDKTKTGKSGNATCTFNPEKVFSALKSFPAQEHCETKSVFNYEDIRLKIDLVTNNVRYEREEGLALRLHRRGELPRQHFLDGGGLERFALSFLLPGIIRTPSSSVQPAARSGPSPFEARFARTSG